MAPSQGRLDWTHWSQACLDVVARDAAAVAPFLRALGPGSGRSPAWHLFTWRERRSLRAAVSGCGGFIFETYLRANWSPQCWHLYGRSPVSVGREVGRWSEQLQTHGSACGGRHAVGG